MCALAAAEYYHICINRDRQIVFFGDLPTDLPTKTWSIKRAK
jgi:hypothetical protein